MNTTTPHPADGPKMPSQSQDRHEPLALAPGQPDLFALTSAWLELDYPDRNGARLACRAEPATGGTQ